MTLAHGGIFSLDSAAGRVYLTSCKTSETGEFKVRSELMLTTARGRLAASGVIAVLAILLSVNGLPGAQTIPGPAAGTPASGEMGMDIDEASPVADAAPMDQSMAQMMENCMAMMEMMGGDMPGMMGGDTPGMMGGDTSGMMATPGTDMEGMDDAVMPTTTPSS